MTFFRGVATDGTRLAAFYIEATSLDRARPAFKAWRETKGLRQQAWLWKVSTVGPQSYCTGLVRALREGHIRVNWAQVRGDRVRPNAPWAEHLRPTALIHHYQQVPLVRGGLVERLPPTIVMRFEEEEGAALQGEAEHL